MQHKEKLTIFHKNIRRSQLEKFFEEKRIKMLEGSYYIETQLSQQCFTETDRNFPSSFDINDLVKISQLTQQEQGIERVKKWNVEAKFQLFLEEEYKDSRQQQYATLILCNLLIIPDTNLPSTSFLNKISHLLTINNLKTISNCLQMIYNLVTNHEMVRDQLIKEHNLIQKLNNLYNIQSMSNSLMMYLLRLTMKIIRRSQRHDSFKKIRQHLIAMLGSQSSLDYDMLLYALSALYQVIVMFKEDFHVIVQSKIISKLIFMHKYIGTITFTERLLQIIDLIISKIPPIQFKQQILPLLKILLNNKFQYQNNLQNKKSKKAIQIITYRIIYKVLEQSMIAADILYYDEKIIGVMIETFRYQESLELLSELAYVFSIVLLNVSYPLIREQIIQLYQQVIQKFPHEIEMVGFINETIFIYEERQHK